MNPDLLDLGLWHGSDQSHQRSLPAQAAQPTITIAVLLLAAAVAYPQVPSPAGRTDLWTPYSSSIHALAEFGGVLYVGGAFSYVGPDTGGAGLLDLSTGAINPDFPFVLGSVYAVVPDDAGGWYIGGWFGQVGDVACTNLAHVSADRSVNSSWRPSVQAPALGGVFALTLREGKVYLAGQFTNVCGATRWNLAAVDALTGQLADWDPQASQQEFTYVSSIAVNGSTIYVGGSFTNIGGATRRSLTAISLETGNVLPWDAALGGDSRIRPSVSSLAIDGNRLFVGGIFYSVSGQRRNCLAWVDVNSGQPGAWRPDPDLSVSAIAPTTDAVYVGGSFTSVGGRSRRGLAALDWITGQAMDWDPSPYGRSYSLAVVNNTVLVAGEFTSIGGATRHNVAAIDRSTGLATAWRADASSRAEVVQSDGTNVFVGGVFDSIGGFTRNGLAAIDLLSGRATDWDPNPSGTTYPEVNSLALRNDLVYVGGRFGAIGGQPRTNLAALNIQTGMAMDWNPNVDDAVYAIALSDNVVLAGGAFTNVGGVPSPHFVALDPASAQSRAWNTATDGPVYSIVATSNAVYVAGAFTNLAGAPRRGLAALDLVTAQLLPWNPEANGPVYALTVERNTVYVGGNFSTVGGQTRNHLAALDALTGKASSWAPQPDATVERLALATDRIYVGGWFCEVNGLERFGLAEVLASTGDVTPWNPNVLYGCREPYITSLAVGASAVHAGGSLFFGSPPHYRTLGVFPLVTPAAPVLSAPRVVNGTLFTFQVTAPPGVTVVVQGSSDLARWSPVETNFMSISDWAVTNKIRSDARHRFYQALIP